MPKERKDQSVSFDRSRASPYPCGSSRSLRSLTKNPLEDEENVKEWELARCSVCMEHPHNAILLMCSSHDKGCRPFMCDTSYRHSNCFDQFRKSFRPGPPPTMPQQEETPPAETAVSNFQVERIEEGPTMKGKLVCPLCRGDINGWMVVEAARGFMNAKSRSCASEACEFSGTYRDLRKHARSVHPLVRPSEADPERERDWRRLERQRDLGDLMSMLQPSTGEERSHDDNSHLTFIQGGGLLTVFLLIRVMQPRSSSRRARAPVPVRRRTTTGLSGEGYDVDSWNRDNESTDGGIRTTGLWGESYGMDSWNWDNESVDGGWAPWSPRERGQRQPALDEDS